MSETNNSVERHPTQKCEVSAHLLLSQKLIQLKEACDYCDLVFELEGVRVPVHRVIMASWSPVIAGMLNPKQACVQHVRVIYNQPDTFKQFVSFLYRGRFEGYGMDISALLHLASTFQISLLRNVCENFIHKSLTVDNVIGYFHTAVKYELSSLESKCVYFLKENLAETVCRSEFRDLEPGQFNSFLASRFVSKLKPELKLFLIISWLRGDVAKRQQYFVMLLGHLDWEVVANDFLLEISQTVNFFTSNPASLYLLLQSLHSAAITLGPYTDQFESLRDQYSYLMATVITDACDLGEEDSKTYEPIKLELITDSEQLKPVPTTSEIISVKKALVTVKKKLNKTRKTSAKGKAIEEKPSESTPSTSRNEDEVLKPSLKLEQKTTRSKASSNYSLRKRSDIRKNLKRKPSVRDNEDSKRANDNQTGDTNDEEPPSKKQNLSQKTKTKVLKSRKGKQNSDRKSGSAEQTEMLKSTKKRIHITVVEDVNGESGGHIRSRVEGERKEGARECSPHEVECETFDAELDSDIDRKTSNETIHNINKQTEFSKKGQRSDTGSKKGGSKKIKNPSKPSTSEKHSAVESEPSDGLEIDDGGPPKDEMVISKAKSINSKGKKAAASDAGPKKSKSSIVLKCDECSFETSEKKKLDKHKRTTHGSQWSFHCPLCEFTSRLVKGFHQHLSEEHFPGPPYGCDDEKCEFTTDKMAVLLTHRLQHSDFRAFVCEVCQMAFRNRNNLYAHLKIHSDERNFVCPTCSKSFKQRTTLEQHLATHSDLRPYLCHLCGFSTKFHSHLIAHRRIHSGEVYSCDFPNCSYGTPKKSLLAAHKRSHTGERPFKCDTCEKSFVEKSHLVRHERTHSTVRNHVCPFCVYASNRVDKLREHMKKHHPNGQESSASSDKQDKGEKAKTLEVLKVESKDDKMKSVGNDVGNKESKTPKKKSAKKKMAKESEEVQENDTQVVDQSDVVHSLRNINPDTPVNESQLTSVIDRPENVHLIERLEDVRQERGETTLPLHTGRPEEVPSIRRLEGVSGDREETMVTLQRPDMVSPEPPAMYTMVASSEYPPQHRTHYHQQSDSLGHTQTRRLVQQPSEHTEHRRPDLLEDYGEHSHHRPLKHTQQFREVPFQYNQYPQHRTHEQHIEHVHQYRDSTHKYIEQARSHKKLTEHLHQYIHSEHTQQYSESVPQRMLDLEPYREHPRYAQTQSGQEHPDQALGLGQHIMPPQQHSHFREHAYNSHPIEQANSSQQIAIRDNRSFSESKHSELHSGQHARLHTHYEHGTQHSSKYIPHSQHQYLGRHGQQQSSDSSSYRAEDNISGVEFFTRMGFTLSDIDAATIPSSNMTLTPSNDLASEAGSSDLSFSSSSGMSSWSQQPYNTNYAYHPRS